MNLLSINYFFRKFSMSLFSFRKITLNLSFVPPIQYWSIIFCANLIGIDNQSRKILNSVAFPRIHFKFTLFCLFYITFRECTMNSLSFRKITLNSLTISHSLWINYLYHIFTFRLAKSPKIYIVFPELPFFFAIWLWIHYLLVDLQCISYLSHKFNMG